jgi:hypothetical protein
VQIQFVLEYLQLILEFAPGMVFAVMLTLVLVQLDIKEPIVNLRFVLEALTLLLVQMQMELVSLQINVNALQAIQEIIVNI